jgi:hypothetical protein
LAELLGLGEPVGDDGAVRGELVDPITQGAERDAEIAGDLLSRVIGFGDETDGLVLEVVGVGDSGHGYLDREREDRGAHETDTGSPREEVARYLLSPTHPEGKGKAAFSRRFGFSPEAWEVLADAFRHAAENEVALRLLEARRPEPETLSLRMVYMSGGAFTEGVETHEVEGVAVKVYSAPKTVADCFKYRSRVGLDVAIEALKDHRRSTDFDADALWCFAKVCRVATVTRPYMEALG